MKKLHVFTLIVVLAFACSAVQAQLFSEDWESGQGDWIFHSTIPPYISDAQNTTPGGVYSLKTADNTTTLYTNTADMMFPVGFIPKAWEVTFNFMDTGSSREYIQLTTFSNGGRSGDLQQIIALGTYNAAPCTVGKYNFRVSHGSVNWADTTVNRQNNVWHSMKIKQDATGKIDIWINDALAASVTTTAVHGFTNIRLGSGLTNAGKGVYFDDINVVPEPGSMLVLGMGLAGLAGAIRRRRA